MSKQYGLILAGQQKKIFPAPVRSQKTTIFDEESTSSSDDNAPQLKPRIATQKGPGAMERRIARQVQEKALAEDPTVFQYDELYDDMESKREEQKQAKAQEPKKPKYITKLLETAERRKLENELRVERQVQKERETEGEQFKDKEAFVTSTYRKKLEEMRKLEKQGKREEYLEAIGDVTKQKDLDGFYRHLYEQKLGTTKSTSVTTAPGDDEISYKPIKSGKPQQQRAYRKRKSSDEDDDSVKAQLTTESLEFKKVHLTNNIDADSDFSIDSSSEEEEEKPTIENKIEKKAQDEEKIPLESKQKESNSITNKNKLKEDADVELPSSTKPILPKPKIDIWKKRTIGAVFEAALQRYFERKAARNVL